MNGNHALDVLTGNKEFPFGEIIDGTLIICLSDDHRKNVAEGFRKVGRYILPGAQCRGHKYTTIIIFTPQVVQLSNQEMARFQNWIDDEVLPTLHPSEGKAYYV